MRARRATSLLPAAAAVAFLALAGCGGGVPSSGPPGAVMPLHLEEMLDSARVVGSAVPEDLPSGVTWRFDAPRPEWRPVRYPSAGQVTVATGEGNLRVRLTDANRLPEGEGFIGAIVVDLPGWTRDEWAELRIEARTDDVRWIELLFNLGERDFPSRDGESRGRIPYLYGGEGARMIGDGQVHTYRLRADWSNPRFGEWTGPWNQLLLQFWAPEPGSIEILSVEVVSKAQLYAGAPAGVRTERRGRAQRRALYAHAPGRIEFRLGVPEEGRLDTGLGVLQSSLPVRFRVTATPDGGDTRELFERTVEAADAWEPAAIDLSSLAGRMVTLALEGDSDRKGAVAFWATPVVSGARKPGRPNVIFYVIDGAGADLMSVYGYNRRTTPNIESIAAEGALFERARSNSAWTKPSTASFMTSLHQSVLGGFLSLEDPIPDAVTPMAEHFHRAGYQTAVLTSNPWAVSMSNLQRGADVFIEQTGRHGSTSSADLQEAFWAWRDEQPGEPYWVHFQTTDVHEPHRPVAPFAGMFVSPDRSVWFHEVWEEASPWHDMSESMAFMKDPANTLSELYRARLESLGVDATGFFNTQRGLYDETMAHQDHQIGRLVERLKARGEWDRTLLVIASDHGHPAGSFSRFGRELFDPPPDSSEGALLDSYRTRIPMIFVWPGMIPPALRLSQDVSMIDMLPTLLDLAGLPMPEVMQGQSLVPLLLGREGWQPRPVILEQLQPVPDRNELVGHIEVIDGRWGASLEIWPDALDGDGSVRPVGQQRAARPRRPDMPRLLLYDVWADPFVRRNVNDRYPDLVEHYTRLLEQQWEAHRTLARRFTGTGEGAALTPEQLEMLRTLGYIR